MSPPARAARQALRVVSTSPLTNRQGAFPRWSAPFLCRGMWQSPSSRAIGITAVAWEREGSAMAERIAAWFRQSGHDLRHAEAALAAGTFDWACLAAAQAADKAIRGVLPGHDAKVLGQQNLLVLIDRLAAEAGLDLQDDLKDDARTLMQGLAVLAGQCTYDGIAPFELITRTQAQSAVAAAGRLRDRMVEASLNH